MGTAGALVREVRRAGTTVARLRELVGGEPEVARAVAARIGLTPALAEELAVRWAGDRAGVGVLRALAAQPATGSEWLALFSVHPDELVRRAVAAHRSTPKPTVRALAADSAVSVRCAVAARDRLPRRVVPVLLDDPAAEVRQTMARRPTAEPDRWPAPVPATSDWRARFDRLDRDGAAAIADRVEGNITEYLTDPRIGWYLHSGDLVAPADLDHDVALVVDGDLTVHGFLDDSSSGLGLLVVLGDLTVRHLVSWGSVHVTGDLHAEGVVHGSYDDHVFEVTGLVHARAVVMADRSARSKVGEVGVEIGCHDPTGARLRAGTG